MSKLKTTAPSIDQQICPNCGNPFTPVSYFTGVEISASTVQVNATQSVTKTQYSDVTPHTGAYCRYCDSINQKASDKIGIKSSLQLYIWSSMYSRFHSSSQYFSTFSKSSSNPSNIFKATIGSFLVPIPFKTQKPSLEHDIQL